MKRKCVKKFISLGTALSVTASLAGCASSEASSVTEAAATPSSEPVSETDEKVQEAKASAVNPNIVYIMLDDMGYSDLGCCGSNVNTPNMDELAETGIQYKNFFTCPLSSPSRAALLTGVDPNVLGMGATADINLGEAVPNIRARMDGQYPTIAHALRDNGYTTLQVGKWHLGPYDEFVPDGDKQHWPSGKGFDKNYTFISSQTSMFEPGGMIEGDNYMEAPFETEGYHLTNDLVDTSIRYIDEVKENDPEQPFFLYFAPAAMHSPLQAPQEYIDKYKGKFDHGWDVEREQRFARQKELGLFPADAILPEKNPGVPDWDDLTADQKKVAAKHMEVYAGFLDHTDEQLGRFFDAFRERGIYDDTIFVLLSDNGANPHGSIYGSISGHTVENAYYYPIEKQLEVMDQFGGKVYGNGYNTGWANTSNTPFKMYKFNAQYGGVRTACMVKWANGIKDPGRISDQVVSVMDITPTMLNITGSVMPKKINGLEAKEMQGISFAETFDSAAPVENGRDHIYVHMATDSALSFLDGYMAVTKPGGGEWELYDMEKDPTQSTNIAAENPEKAAELAAAYEKLRAEEYNGQNLIVDIMRGVKPEVLIDRYGDLAKNVLAGLSGAPLADSQVAEYVKILQYASIDNNRGTILYAPEDSKLNKDIFTYTKDQGYFTSLAAAPTNAVSHEISFKATYEEGQEGVLLANGGGYDGGYSIYIKDGKLHYMYNFSGEQQELISEQTVPAGEIDVNFRYEKENLYEGNAILMLNGQQAAQKKIKTLPMFTSYDYFSVGEDVGSNVSYDYEGRFAYPGEIGEVTISLGKDKAKKNERPNHGKLNQE